METVEKHKGIANKYRQQYQVYVTKLEHYNKSKKPIKSTNVKPNIDQHMKELLPQTVVKPCPPKKPQFVLHRNLIKSEMAPCALALHIDYLSKLDELRSTFSESGFIHCVETYEVEQIEAEISKYEHQTWAFPKSPRFVKEIGRFSIRGVKTV